MNKTDAFYYMKFYIKFKYILLLTCLSISIISKASDFEVDGLGYNRLSSNQIKTNNENIISFEDANVKAICVANWDKNDDGELSEDEAAAVTYLGGVFYENTTITSFEEFQFFVGIEDLSSAFRNCSNLKKVLIPSSVKTIGKWAFQNCSALTGTLVIPSSVTSIGESAFEECSGFTGALTIPESVTSIGERAFLGCVGFNGSLSLPNSLTSIGKHAFYGCSGFTGNLTIPESVISIGGWAFQDCSGFSSTLTIPNSVESIGYAAFWGCSNINKVISQILSPIQIDVDVFRGISSDAVLQVPKGTKAQYLNYTGWTKYFKEIIEEGDDITYSLSISATGNGSASFGDSTIKNQTSTFTVNEGLSATITFSPDSGNKIKSVKVNDTDVTSSVSSNEYTISNITADTSVEVEFEAITHTLSIKASGNGSASYSGSTIKNKTSTFTVNEGSPATITFSPDSGNKIKSVKVNSSDVTSSISDNEYTISNITADTSVEVEFEPITYTLSIKASGNGSASYNGSTIKNKTSTFTVNEGTSATVSFSPDKGYRIKSVKVNNTDVTSNVSSNQYTINNISGNITLEVEFEAIPVTTYTLSIKAMGNGSASYNGTTFRGKTSTFTVNEGTSATVSFNPDNGYRIKSVKVNGTDVTSSVSSNYYTISNISANTTLEVEFEAIPPTTYTLSIKATGNGSASYNGTTIRSKTNTFTVNEGANAIVTFAPDNGYRIKSVKVNSADVTSSVSSNQYTINNISANTTLEVEFEAIPATTYTLSIKVTGNGSVLYNETTIRSKTSTFTVNDGASVSISITPDNGYRIKSVKENNTNVTSYVSNNTYTISSISRNTTIEVEFEAIPQTTYTLSIKATGNGYVSYNGTTTHNETNSFTINEGYNALLTFVSESGYRLASVRLNNSDVSSWVYNNQYTISNISSNTSVEVTFEAIPVTTYSLSISASGNGYATYNGSAIRNRTTSFTVDEGTSATIIFTPDNGNSIASVKLNNSDITSQISGNSYTISNITANTTLTVTFQEDVNALTVDGLNYTVTSQSNKTVTLTSGGTGLVLTVPATITQNGTTWKVTGIDNNALKGNTELAAIIWNPESAFTATVSNPNLLLYVKAEQFAPASIQNVVINGTASNIILAEAKSGNNFYCPQSFVAQKISFTHNYQMQTGIGEARGWETIALPFDVQTITHATKGEIKPFANWKSSDAAKPFWLMELTGTGFVETGNIKAYTPYIISMPNNPQYDSQWLLNGKVTFAASGVTVGKTDQLQEVTYKDRTFIPCFVERGAAEGFYALNVSNDYETNNSGMTEGSRFVLNMRSVHPFEAYMTTASNAASYIDVFDDMTTGIHLMVNGSWTKQEVVYDLQGRKLNTPSKKGVYIVNGKKKIIK